MSHTNPVIQEQIKNGQTDKQLNKMKDNATMVTDGNITGIIVEIRNNDVLIECGLTTRIVKRSEIEKLE